MTVSSTTKRNSYTGDGSTTTFAYSFKIFDDDDITVILRTTATGTETVQTKTTHYSVTGVGSASGGNVVFGSAPTSAQTVVLLRQTAQTQATDYTPNDPFPAASHEDALDKLTLITQDQQDELDRSIKLSRTNTMTSTEFTVGATDRANKILAFDSSGELSVTQELGTNRGDWAASTSYNQRDIVKDTSTGNIFFVNEAHTSSGSQPLTTNTNSSKYDLLIESLFSGVTAGTVSASKGVLVDGNKDITGFRNITLSGELTLGSGAVINEAELEAIDGVTAGTVAASKAVVVDSNKDAASFRNITLTGELDAGSLDVSGDADIDGTLEADAMTLNGTAITATATLDTGISNNNVPKFTSGVADNDFLRVDGTAIEGRSASEVLSDIAAAPAAGSSNIVTTGALNSGSITSGFGAIDNGSSAITTTGTITGGVVDVDGLTCSGTATIEGTSTFGTSSGDTRFNFDGPNQYRAVFKHSGNIAGQIGGGGADELRFSNAAGAIVASITGGGLTFNGDTATANALDDYEEGDWTPDIRQSGTAVSDAAYNTSFTAGQYTKVGRIVHMTCSIRLTSKGSPTSSNNFQIGGLPFTSTNNIKARTAVSLFDHVGAGFDTSGNTNGTLMGILSHNADEITFRVTDVSGTTGEAIQYADVGDTLYLQLAFSFITG